MSRIKIESLRKIPIKEICQDGWLKRSGNLTISLQHHPEGICLFVDGVKQQQVLWKVYERKIAGNISYRGGYIPTDKAWDWYVYGRDGKRYKHLYLLVTGPNNFSIGTRAKNEFNATYSRCCLSRRKGMAVRDARLLRLSKRMLKRKLATGTTRTPPKISL
jgi:hypothetical protein